MKTKKTYTSCRVGLFIGLFSFHTLSSCVNTGRALGVIENHAKQTEPLSRADIRELEEQDEVLRKRYLSDEPTSCCKKELGIWALKTVGAVCVVTPFIALYLRNMLSETNPIRTTTDTFIGNTTTALTTLETGVDSVTTTGGSIIVNGTKILGAVFMPLFTAAGLSEKFKSNGLNLTHNSSSAKVKEPFIPTDLDTADMPSKSIAKPYNTELSILSQEILDEIQEHENPISKITDLIEKGQSINSIDSDGTPILSYAIGTNDWELFKFLVDKGADVNLPDNKGYTPMMYIDPNASNSKRMYEYLLQNRADPCIKNKRGQRMHSRSGIESLVNPELLEIFKKKCL